METIKTILLIIVAANVVFLVWAALRYRVRSSTEWQLGQEVLAALRTLDEAECERRIRRFWRETFERSGSSIRKTCID